MHNCKGTLQNRQTERDGQQWASDGYHQEEHCCPCRKGRQEAPHVDRPSPSKHLRASHVRAASELPSLPQLRVPCSFVLGLGRGLRAPLVPAGKVADCFLLENLLCRPCDHSCRPLGVHLLLHTNSAR